MEKMDFHSVMETFAEAWVAANTHTPLTEAAGQGLINGPSNPNPTNHGPNTQPQPVFTVLQESPKQQIGNVPVAENNCVPVAENNHIPVAENNRVPVAENNRVPMAENNRVPVAENNRVPVAENNRIPVAENNRVPVAANNRVPERLSSAESPSNCPSGDNKTQKVQEVHGGKCLPVHCIIEQIPGPQACGQYVELDSYAIVPNDTLFSDLVRTALGKLGYSGAQILGAKGSIQVKKWKTLAFDQITENPEATVGDILGDLTTMASLHVRLYSVPENPHEWIDITVRNAVLELLREMSQLKLAKLCPLSQPMLSNIINHRYMGKIGKEKCQEFGQWYLAYRKQHPEGSAPEVIPSDKPVDGRLTFHPTKELPIMRDWFHGCRNPSRRTLQMYVDVLNQAPVRQQERPKIAFSTLKNWWKNEKQRERKIQRSDDKSPEAGKPKRKKKSEEENIQKDSSIENGIQHFSGSSSQDTPPKTNNFTLINHSENESDLDRFGRKDGELSVSEIVSENSLVTDSSHHFHSCPSCPTDITKENCKFSLLGHSDIDRNVAENRLNGHISHPIKDPLAVESPFFHKLHTVCIDHPHSLFSFSDPHLSIQNSSKIFCDNAGRTNIMDSNNSRLSSEDDVDVGI